MRLATRFYLAIAGVLLPAGLLAPPLLGLDAGGRWSAWLILAGLMVVFMPVSRLLERGVRERVQEAEDALRRLGAGDFDVSAGGAGADPVDSLGRSIDRMAEELRHRERTARRESEDLRALFEGLDEGLACIDETGSVSRANPAFERWAGRAVTPGVRIASLFRAPGVLEAVSQARGGSYVVEEIEIGESRVLLSARPHRSGALLVLRDLTKIRRLEGVRRDFVANVSHELKTPLTSVVGFAEALAVNGLGPDRARDFAERILANATRMRSLVEDLLDLSLLESGSWHPAPEPVSIGALAGEVWETLPPDLMCRHGGLEIAGADEQAYVDPDAIRQILRNLLDNAARYSDSDDPIEVRVRSQELVLRVEVADSGPGIPSVHLERVFERFYRVDPARSRQRGGTGLGLAIVKHFVEAHGGEVGIESELARGTTVWFTLPVAAESLER